MGMARSAPKIGIFGGTFDPIHVGHLRAAEEVREALGLKRVLFVLSARPPHKGGVAHAPAEDRWEMLRRALGGNPHFEACDVELRREGLSYSIDTVRELSRKLQAECYFIVGEDSFRGIQTWKDWQQLLELCPFIVMRRTEADLTPFLKTLGYRERGEGRFETRRGTPLLLLPVTPIRVSATLIRNLIKRGQSIRYLVPDPVREYILEKHLYLNPIP